MVIIKFVIFNVWFKKWTALKISTVTIFQVCVGGIQKKKEKKIPRFSDSEKHTFIEVAVFTTPLKIFIRNM